GVYFNITLPKRQKLPIFGVLFALLGIVISKTVSSNALFLISNLVGFIASFWHFYRNRVLFVKSQPILSILQVGVVWLILGFVSGIFEAIFEFSSLLQTHIFGVGFIGTMIIGFGSRVVLGHSGEKINADKITVIIFVIFQSVVLLRLMAVYMPSLLGISAIAWCIVFAIWFKRYLPNLLKLDS
ncbi:MAG: hypothetical protein RL154_1669, partial [Pseudomonadota bacterium]